MSSLATTQLCLSCELSRFYFLGGPFFLTEMYRFDIILSPTTIEDIDHDSSEFDRAFQPAEGPNNGLLNNHQTMRFPILYLSHAGANIRLSELYDSLIRDWLSPLSNKIPNKIRASKERIIRTVSTNLMLSSITILPDRVNQDQSQNQNQSQSQSQSQMTIPDDDLNTQRSEPASSAQNEPSPEASEAYSSLRKYTTLKHGQRPSKRASATLSHWNAGDDPYAYSWQTSKASEQEAHYSENESGLTRRRKARRQRMRKSSVVSSAVSVGLGVGSSQVGTPMRNTPMEKAWGSQPEVNAANVNSQTSQGVGIGFPMSQMERGLFGGRETRRKSTLGGAKRPKRVAGF